MNHLLSFFMAVLLGMYGISASAHEVNPLPASLKATLAALGVPGKDVHIYVRGVHAHKTLLAYHARQAVSPASTMKLVTTYSALYRFGPAHVFKTAVYFRGKISHGVLHGDLVIHGGGDPDLTLQRFWLMVRTIRRAGIRAIQGNLVLDERHFSLPPFDPAAFDHHPQDVYNTGPNALLVNFDATRFYLTPSGQGVRLYFDPDMNLFQINNQVRLTSGPCKDFEDGIHIKVNQTGSRVKARLMGRYPAQCKERSLNYRLLGNTAYVGALFQSLWHELGGTFSGGVKRGRVEPGDTKLLDWKSRPLASMIRDMNKFSNNVMARILFLDLSDKTPVTLEASRQVVEQILAESGLRFPELIIENGSGLSRRAQINVQHLGQLLNVAWHSPFMPEFVASLPVLGQDGTLRKRLRHGPVAGRAHIKTGTLDNSDAIAGYLDDAYQQNWIVVCIVENTPEMKAKRIEDTLLMWLYRH